MTVERHAACCCGSPSGHVAGRVVVAHRRAVRRREPFMKYFLAIIIGIMLLLFGLVGGLLDLIF